MILEVFRLEINNTLCLAAYIYLYIMAKIKHISKVNKLTSHKRKYRKTSKK